MRLKEFLEPTKSKIVITLLIPFFISQPFYIFPFPLIITIPIYLVSFFYIDPCSVCSELSCLACTSPILHFIIQTVVLFVNTVINYTISSAIIFISKSRNKMIK